jgi:phospholipase C
MGYFTRDDIPWRYALADQYTICDQYFCSLNGPTVPNRLYQWSGTVDPAGKNGGPVVENPPDYKPVYGWKTYPERLHEAGVSWRTYANDEVGDGDGDDGWVGDYGDNPMWLFHRYHESYAATGAAQDLALRAALHGGWKPNSGRGRDLDYLLSAFIADVAHNTLPTVSYVVSPYLYSEHPLGRPTAPTTCKSVEHPLEQSGGVGKHGGAHQFRRERRVLRSRDSAVPADRYTQRIHQRTADRSGAAGTDDGGIAMEYRGLDELAGV